MIVAVECLGASDALVRAILAGLGAHNELWYRLTGDPRDPAEHVAYLPDAPAKEVRLLDAPEVLEAGAASCGSLAAARYGYLRARGEWVSLIPRNVGPGLWHVVLRLQSGQIWDPKEVRRAA